jgi:gluconokinase
MTASPIVVIVMGVTASGKTTAGAAFASERHVPFCDADDLHPPGNKQKMSQGIPLTDEDRYPWLAAVRDVMWRWVAAASMKDVCSDDCREGRVSSLPAANTAPLLSNCGPAIGVVVGVIACSALKIAYRKFLRQRSTVSATEPPARGQLPLYRVVFVYCKISPELALLRAVARQAHHFVAPTIVSSQFSVLEEPTTEEFETAGEDEDGTSTTLALCKGGMITIHQTDDAGSNSSSSGSFADGSVASALVLLSNSSLLC